MNKRVKNSLLTLGLFLIVVSVLVLCASTFMNLGLGGSQFVFFFTVFIFVTLPMVSYGFEIINSTLSPIQYSDLYVQTVDSILNMESFDEVLRDTFDQILDLIRVQVGFLIFYYHDRNEFNIFYQKNKRKRIIRRAKISQDNILFKVVKGPDDIVIKSALRPLVHIEKAIIDELDRLNGEVVVPIYYHEMFLGMIVTGERKRRFQEAEIRLLKIFASRIAILSVNSFFFKEIIRKRELEKDYELARRVQKKFLPDSSVESGKIQVRVFHEPKSLMVREFYDVFINDSGDEDVRISAYRIKGNILGTSILMPGIQSMLQSFARLGLPPSRSVARLRKILRERDLVDEYLLLLHGSIKQNGNFNFCNDSYQPPLLFRKKTRRLSEIKIRDKKNTRMVRLRPGDVIVIAGGRYHTELTANPEKYGVIMGKNSTSLAKSLGALVKGLGDGVEEDGEDKLLMLIGMEGGV